MLSIYDVLEDKTMYSSDFLMLLGLLINSFSFRKGKKPWTHFKEPPFLRDRYFFATLFLHVHFSTSRQATEDIYASITSPLHC
jgi:hypothetical protein